MTSWFCSPASGTPEGGYSPRRHLPLHGGSRWWLLTFVLNACSSGPLGRTVEEAGERYLSTSRSSKQKLPRLNGWKTDLKAQLKEARQKSQSLILDAEQGVWTGLPPVPWPLCQAEANARQGKLPEVSIDRERKACAGITEIKADQLGGSRSVKRCWPVK